jgi:hypothetical protein
MKRALENMPLLAADLGEAFGRLPAQHVPAHAGRAHERAQSATLDEVARVTQVLDGAAHGDTTHAIRLGELRLGGNLALGRIDPIVDGRLDIFIDALV